MAKANFKVGDHVKWESGGREAVGRVVHVATQSGRVGDFVYDASERFPRYIVETDEGRQAAHRPEALRPA